MYLRIGMCGRGLVYLPLTSTVYEYNMATQPNIELLKQYIKTLIAPDAIFPGIAPRQFENEFSRTELEAIYFCLTFVVKQANPVNHQALISGFKRVHKPNLAMHWFLRAFWRQLVSIIYIHSFQTKHFYLPMN